MDLFQADSEALQEVVQIFQGEAESLQQAFQNFQSVAENIRGYDWIGLGADTFFDEFDSELVPDANKLVGNLEMVAERINRVSTQLEDGIAHILSVARAQV